MIYSFYSLIVFVGCIITVCSIIYQLLWGSSIEKEKTFK